MQGREPQPLSVRETPQGIENGPLIASLHILIAPHPPLHPKTFKTSTRRNLVSTIGSVSPSWQMKTCIPRGYERRRGLIPRIGICVSSENFGCFQVARCRAQRVGLPPSSQTMYRLEEVREGMNGEG